MTIEREKQRVMCLGFWLNASTITNVENLRAAQM